MHLEDAFLCVSMNAGLAGVALGEWCRDAICGGADLIMVSPDAGDEAQLKAVAAICEEEDAILVVSGSPETGSALDAQGVHLSGMDSNIGEARAIMGLNKLVGVSVDSIDEARLATEIGADYLLYAGGDLSLLPTLRSIAAVPMYVLVDEGVERAKDVVDSGVFRLCVNGGGIASGDVSGSMAEFSRLLGRCI